jgi:long-chain acyl-CoA synthetase
MAEIEARIGPDDTVTICYTSGTTGNRKAYADPPQLPAQRRGRGQSRGHREGLEKLIMLPLDHSFAHTVGIYIFLQNACACTSWTPGAVRWRRSATCLRI